MLTSFGGPTRTLLTVFRNSTHYYWLLIIVADRVLRNLPHCQWTNTEDELKPFADNAIVRNAQSFVPFAESISAARTLRTRTMGFVPPPTSPSVPSVVTCHYNAVGEEIILNTPQREDTQVTLSAVPRPIRSPTLDTHAASTHAREKSQVVSDIIIEPEADQPPQSPHTP